MITVKDEGDDKEERFKLECRKSKRRDKTSSFQLSPQQKQNNKLQQQTNKNQRYSIFRRYHGCIQIFHSHNTDILRYATATITDASMSSYIIIL